MHHFQATSHVIMVRPTSFGFDPQTAQTNHFQNEVTLPDASVRRQADAEFSAMVASLRSHGVTVTVFEDPDPAPKPNAVFPNNWLSMWPDGTIYLYPMATKSRRIERSHVLIDMLRPTTVVDISQTENTGVFLESTGVMIFDHINKLVYGCISPRCDAALFKDHAKTLGYTPLLFHAVDREDQAIYHTNVMLGIQITTAVICAEAITDPGERAMVIDSLKDSGRDVIEITYDQMDRFAANVLELASENGKHHLALSQQAYDAFDQSQRDRLSKDKELLPFNVTTIETVGGGSVRCMLAENFLSERGD